ncbi:cell wall metabolism sensor histidine kinase WalK [Nocardioides sp. zg-1228]|uniref:sensor histidine kinase n=1 Tax=Nocardioides sp. zg-1228 TaxID=2763008 RepID=UPI001642EFF3|nr:ATP-binding protein [Nocardioides sp. zg-1228]MBC2932762.1 two-component sensor histidine kinase [Nocardioides sp. zg-1228]QSF58233.1 two-component sensor histidine kinase [Nocardioides sp. zg-1228]
MDPTTQAALAALAGAIMAGGAVLAWHISDRQRRTPPETEEPVVQAGVAAVLSILRSSAVVVDESDHVVKASAPAYAFGLVRGDTVVVPELLDLVAQVRRDGQIRESDLDIAAPDGRVTRTLTARVAPLGARLVLALVEDRTRERRVEEVRRDFVANVSHELKTPVGAIRLLAEAVADASDDPEAVQRFAGRMLTESDRLSRLVQQIIELSRLQGHDPLETPVMVDLDAAVATAVDTSATEAAAKQITVESRGEPGLAVFGSQEQIGAAVSNLVANAVAYSNEGSRVVVTSRSVGEQVQISVVDQGIGIPAGEIERIFERFYRVDPARHRSTGGTGLGLAIVKHVAATHGGDIAVWSVQGQGSTFTLTLPRGPEPGTGRTTTPVEVVAPARPASAPDATPDPADPADPPARRAQQETTR